MQWWRVRLLNSDISIKQMSGWDNRDDMPAGVCLKCFGQVEMPWQWVAFEMLTVAAAESGGCGLQLCADTKQKNKLWQLKRTAMIKRACWICAAWRRLSHVRAQQLTGAGLPEPTHRLRFISPKRNRRLRACGKDTLLKQLVWRDKSCCFFNRFCCRRVCSVKKKFQFPIWS